MESTKGQSKPKSKLKALLVLIIIIVAAVGGGYYYLSTSPKMQFTIAPSPTLFRVVPGLGALITINVTRLPGFTGDVNVTVANAPSWVNYHPISIPSSASNGNLAIGTAQSAPKGTAQLTLSATAPNSAAQTATLAMRVVGSYNFTTPAGRGQIYDTTKILDNATIKALVSYVNGTVTFSQSTSQLQSLESGDVIMLQPNMSTAAPNGFSRVVLNVQNSSGQVLVSTKQASLLDIFVTLHIGTPTQITNSTSGLSGTSVQSINAPQDEMPNTCPNDGNTYWLFGPGAFPKGGLNGVQIASQGSVLLTAELTYGLCLHAVASISVHWGGCFSGPETLGNTVCPIPYPGLDYAELTLQGFAEANFELNGQANSVVTEWTVPLLDIAGPSTITIVPGLLWIDYHLYLEGEASGHIGNHNVDMKAYAKAGFVEGPAYKNGGWTWLNQEGFDHSCNFCSMDLPTVEALQGMSMRFGVGPRLDGDIDSGVVSAYIALHGFAELDVLNIPSNPLWTLWGGLDYSVGIGGFFGAASWNHSDTIFQVPIMSAQPYPPPTPVLLILNSANTIDLSNPGGIHSPNPISGWGATMSADPQGFAVTCIWNSNEVGQLATTMATGNSLLACPGPSVLNFPINQIIAKGLNQLTVTVVAQDSTGLKSSPSNAVTVKVLLPTPQLQILCTPCSPTTITQSQPFTVQGRATLSTVVSTADPNGIIDLCQSEPQNIAWFVGGSFEADIVNTGEGAWTGAQSYGSGCNAALTATNPGQTTIYLVLGSTDPQTGNWYIPEDVNSNPINGVIVSVTVTVQAQTSSPPPPPSGVSPLVVTITSPTEGASSPQHTPTSNPIVSLQGTVSGGTAPYTATWTAIYDGQSYTIDTFPSTGIHPIGLAFPNDRWNLASSSYCSQYGFVNGLVAVSLSVTDSNGQTVVPPTSGSANIDCVQIQTISPVPGVALVSLLTVLFTVTAESKNILESKPWLHLLRGTFTVQI